MQSKLCTVFLFCLFLQNTFLLNAQQDKFIQPGSIQDVHVVYTYQKSNWDGSNASQVFLYIKDTNQLESFKWNEGESWSTLVSAALDWNKFVVNKIQNHRIDMQGNKTLVAELNLESANKIKFHIGDFQDSMILVDPFWHSYDFDFASIGFAWRALIEKRNSFSFHIADAALINNKPGFENKGKVKVEFLNEEWLNGKQLLKYKIDGQGLQNKGGFIWVNPGNNYMIELFKIEHPDEEGYVNGQLKLLKTEYLSLAEWEKFILKKMNGN